jgi:hypothetical protein
VGLAILVPDLANFILFSLHILSISLVASDSNMFQYEVRARESGSRRCFTANVEMTRPVENLPLSSWAASLRRSEYASSVT